tara:strand:+ start:3903 stop:4325 length:423 start_codon:yes stop_codon:yes gene_type:complete
MGEKRKVQSSDLNEIGKKKRKYDKCLICLEDMKDDNKLYHLSCNHTFHNTCIWKWFKIKDTCPCCRKKQFPSDDIFNQISNELTDTMIDNFNLFNLNFENDNMMFQPINENAQQDSFQPIDIDKDPLILDSILDSILDNI